MPARQVAIILPLTGDHGHIGSQILDAIQMALDEHPGLTWTVVDTQGEPRMAARRVRDLVENPATVAVVGPVGRAESEAAVEAAQAVRLPILALSSREGLEDAGRYAFRFRVAPEEQARWVARLAIGRLGLTRLAVLYPEDPVGQVSMQAFVEEVVASGRAQVTAVESYPVDETNFSAPIERMVHRRYRQLRLEAFRQAPRTRVRRLSHRSTVDFDAVFIPDNHHRVGLVIPFLSFWDVPVGRPTQLLGVSSWGGEGLEKAEALADGALFPMIFHRDMYYPPAGDFATRFEARFERAPSEAEAQAYDAIVMIAHSLSSLPAAATREHLVDALVSGPWVDGVAGPMRFSEAGAVERDFSLFAADRNGSPGPFNLLR